MQIIRAVAVSAANYVTANCQKDIQPPPECPHCGLQDTLIVLGYYSRNVSDTERGVCRILVRRFRCANCRRTVSILPSFAQPYRLVANSTINEFFAGTLKTNDLPWLPLLKQYWNRFSNWLPEIDHIVKSMAARSPPQPDAAGWWNIIETLGGLERTTMTLVEQFAVTLFGRYRCHSACSDVRSAN